MADALLRSMTAALHQAQPQIWCRRVDQVNGAVTTIESPEQAAAALAEQPAGLRCGNLLLALGDGPDDLVSGGGDPGNGPLVGQVIVVSGAASGLGLGLARGLHAAGAAVLLTDIDRPGLAEAVASFADPLRIDSVMMNVTDETSVAQAFDAALARWGRLDAIACCAGIAPPFNLVDFPLDKWRLALEINLTGYFLMGREAARIMIQHGHGGAMVLLSSKSGLEPSKANSAYNATKAGELHLARGWALELGGHDIRVNCIAPGNVFEGSKIWNPDYIRKAAEKKGITPEQVIPHYNALTALNAEIKPQDIANAAVFLCSTAARRITGQVLVVDAGQVWTR